VNGTGPAVAWNGTALNPLVYPVNSSLAAMAIVPCIQNQIAAVPLCTQVNISYIDGSTVRLEFEGTTTRFYINETRRNLTCEITSTLPAGIMSTVQDYSGIVQNEVQSLSIDTVMTNTALRVKKELAIHKTSSVFTQVLLNTTGLYRKPSLLCCLAEFIDDLGQFAIAFGAEWVYTFRALMTLPANIPGFIFPVPTFSDALAKLRASACALACAITHICTKISFRFSHLFFNLSHSRGSLFVWVYWNDHQVSIGFDVREFSSMPRHRYSPPLGVDRGRVPPKCEAHRRGNARKLAYARFYMQQHQCRGLCQQFHHLRYHQDSLYGHSDGA
jgi:hypothetical protein